MCTVELVKHLVHKVNKVLKICSINGASSYVTLLCRWDSPNLAEYYQKKHAFTDRQKILTLEMSKIVGRFLFYVIGDNIVQNSYF